MKIEFINDYPSEYFHHISKELFNKGHDIKFNYKCFLLEKNDFSEYAMDSFFIPDFKFYFCLNNSKFSLNNNDILFREFPGLDHKNWFDHYNKNKDYQPLYGDNSFKIGEEIGYYGELTDNFYWQDVFYHYFKTYNNLNIFSYIQNEYEINYIFSNFKKFYNMSDDKTITFFSDKEEFISKNNVLLFFPKNKYTFKIVMDCLNSGYLIVTYDNIFLNKYLKKDFCLRVHDFKDINEKSINKYLEKICNKCNYIQEYFSITKYFDKIKNDIQL